MMNDTTPHDDDDNFPLDPDTFWKQAAADYARLRNDPAAWQSYPDDIAAWDGTLLDGLADDPWDEDDAGDPRALRDGDGAG